MRSFGRIVAMRLHYTLVVLSTVAAARAARAQNPVTWSAKVSGHAVPGGRVSLVLTAAIEHEWHIYSLTQNDSGPIPTQIIVVADQPFTLADTITADDPDVKFDDGFGMNVELYQGNAQFTVPLAVDAAIKSGAQTIGVKVRYQACNARVCLPVKTVKLSALVTTDDRKNAVKGRRTTRD